jgi:hypothetical protein
MRDKIERPADETIAKVSCVWLLVTIYSITFRLRQSGVYFFSYEPSPEFSQKNVLLPQESWKILSHGEPSTIILSSHLFHAKKIVIEGSEIIH